MCLTWPVEVVDGAAEAANAVAVSDPLDMSAVVDSRAAAEPAQRLRLLPGSDVERSVLELKELPFFFMPIKTDLPAHDNRFDRRRRMYGEMLLRCC